MLEPIRRATDTHPAVGRVTRPVLADVARDISQVQTGVLDSAQAQAQARYDLALWARAHETEAKRCEHAARVMEVNLDSLYSTAESFRETLAQLRSYSRTTEYERGKMAKLAERLEEISAEIADIEASHDALVRVAAERRERAALLRRAALAELRG